MVQGVKRATGLTSADAVRKCVAGDYVFREGDLGTEMYVVHEGRVEILKRKRSHFGSLYLEGYSQLIWRPVAGP